MILSIWVFQTGAFIADLLARHHELIDYVTRSVALAGTLHTIMPPWNWRPKFVTEGLADFPTAQKAFYGAFSNRWYKLLVYIVGYVALHARSTLWRSLSIDNPKGVNTRLASSV